MSINNKLKRILLVGALAGSLFSCNDFEEMNTDPDQPSEVPASFLLTSGQKYSMENVWDEWANGRFGLIYSQYWSQQAYSSESRFKYRDSSVNSQWNSYFGAGGLKDLQKSMDIAKELLSNDALSTEAKEKASNEYAAAQVTKVWLTHLMTDIWGPIPYSEALQGNLNRAPKYDSQEAVYTGLLAELDAAYDMFFAGGAMEGDVIFNGDAAKWKKFTKSLKLRIALRMADRDSGAALATVVSEGGFMEEGDDALLVFGGAPHNNPLNEDRKTRQDFAASNTMVDLLKTESDPRLKLFYTTAKADGEFRGVVYGLTDNDANNLDLDQYSQPSAAVLDEKAPGIYMTYAEVCFALAEAAQRAGNAAEAEAQYEAGIRASMKFWNGQAATAGMTEMASQAEIDDYITAHPYDAVEWKKSIGVQKWIALYMQGHQGWIEWRRLDFGILREPVAGAMRGNGDIPVRRPYPTGENELNGAMYTEAVNILNGEAGFTGSSEFNGDNLNNPVWWDVNPGSQVEVDDDGNVM